MSIFDFFKRVNGFSLSTPIVGAGIQWDNQQHYSAERIAREVIVFLEDRRVLYTEQQFETLRYCIDSIIQIRSRLTDFIIKLPLSKNENDISDLEICLREMRTACQMAMTTFAMVEDINLNGNYYGYNNRLMPEYDFVMGLIVLRSIFAKNIYIISRLYNIPIREPRLQLLIDALGNKEKDIDLASKQETIDELKDIVNKQEAYIEKQQLEVKELKEQLENRSFYRRFFPPN